MSAELSNGQPAGAAPRTAKLASAATRRPRPGLAQLWPPPLPLWSSLWGCARGESGETWREPTAATEREREKRGASHSSTLSFFFLPSASKLMGPAGGRDSEPGNADWLEARCKLPRDACSPHWGGGVSAVI